MEKQKKSAFVCCLLSVVMIILLVVDDNGIPEYDTAPSNVLDCYSKCTSTCCLKGKEAFTVTFDCTVKYIIENKTDCIELIVEDKNLNLCHIRYDLPSCRPKLKEGQELRVYGTNRDIYKYESGGLKADLVNIEVTFLTKPE